MLTVRLAAAFAAAVFAIPPARIQPSSAQEPGPGPRRDLTLSVKTDKKSYRRGDSIFMEVKIENLAREKIQLASPDYTYFYVVWEDASGGRAHCAPLSSYQFVPEPHWAAGVVTRSWLEPGTVERQQTIYGGKLGEWTPQAYRFRIAYTTQHRALEDLLERTYGRPVGVDSQGPGPLPGAFEGALLSEPVTITIDDQD